MDGAVERIFVEAAYTPSSLCSWPDGYGHNLAFYTAALFSGTSAVEASRMGSC